MLNVIFVAKIVWNWNVSTECNLTSLIHLLKHTHITSHTQLGKQGKT